MLKKIASSVFRLTKQQVAANVYSTSAAIPPDYIIRKATENDHQKITEIRAEELWGIPLSQREAIDAWSRSLGDAAREPGYHILVAAKEHENATEILGAVDLLLATNATVDVHNGNVPDEWKSFNGLLEDAYLTELAVSAKARRRRVASNLLAHAKDMAVAEGMKRLFVQVDKDNHAAFALNKHMGYEYINFDERSRLALMGLKL